jgi:hypothetical protein
MLLDNIDLNIWDKKGYETEYAEEGWVITPYIIESAGAGFGSGPELENIELTPAEAKQLTLGVAMADGGDYTPDADFWIDFLAFCVTYSHIPERVLDELKQRFDVVDDIAGEKHQHYMESMIQ